MNITTKCFGKCENSEDLCGKTKNTRLVVCQDSTDTKTFLHYLSTTFSTSLFQRYLHVPLMPEACLRKSSFIMWRNDPTRKVIFILYFSNTSLSLF